MKRLLPFFVLLLITTIANAQAKPKALRKVLSLQMALTVDDDMPGTRGASVVWHPLQKKYYAAMAGNVSYPLCVFDATGKRLSADEHTTQADIRGLWYNPANKAIEGNQYSDYGWFRYSLDAKGMIKEVEETQEGMNQPGEQNVGAYNAAKKQVLFLKGSQVYFYSAATAMLIDSLPLHWGKTKAEGAGDDEDISYAPEGYNSSTVIYTGIAGGELGLLNIAEMKVELYDIKSGFLTKALPLPEDAIAEPTFNFAFANGIFWLFDMEGRVWMGYK
jgi:hypothetical protein